MSSDSEEDKLLETEKDQSTIREELSQMTFEDLQKLKEKLGTKVYNAAMFGVNKVKKNSFKRENKNRPAEATSKKQVSRFREIIPVKKKNLRDPRFDSLCGEFNEKAFKNAYSFLSDIKKNDVMKLQQELKNEEDPKRIKKIKYLIQRLENQLREEEKQKIKEDGEKEGKREIIDAIKTGKKPQFQKKSEKRMTGLVSQYEDLKNSGKLKKHIQRIRKKHVTRDRLRLNNSGSE